MAKTASKNLITSIVFLVLAVIVGAGAIFAWFISNESSTARDLSLSIQPQDRGALNTKFTIGNGQIEHKEIKEDLAPGDFKSFVFSFVNNEAVTVFFRPYFSSVKVKFPDYPQSRDLNKYLCDLYSDSSSYDLPANISAQVAMEAFAEPYSNAVSFCAYMGETLDFSQAQPLFKNFTSQPSEFLELDSEDYQQILKNRNIFEYYLPSLPAGMSADGWFAVAPGAMLKINFALYFDGSIGTSAEIGNKTVEMRNSNGFMWQQMDIVIGISQKLQE